MLGLGADYVPSVPELADDPAQDVAVAAHHDERAPEFGFDDHRSLVLDGFLFDDRDVAWRLPLAADFLAAEDLVVNAHDQPLAGTEPAVLAVLRPVGVHQFE